MILHEHMEIAKKVKKLVHEIDPSAKVYVFGSVVRNEATTASDIDVLVITREVGRKYDIMIKVFREADERVELHVVDEAMFDRWYRRFIPEDELVGV
ncbi:MAG: nucleotidyltransferase domain-containing protein [Candidatus Caldarchaeum sp.]|nr:nucleotidyltransferase domain-containing protein [Candidatus Caldarchaeum sp.]